MPQSASEIRPHLTLVPKDPAPATTPSQRNEAAASDRRRAPRHPASALEWLNGVRLKYGPNVGLIDLSTGGAQIETTNYSLQPGSTVIVQIAGGDSEVSIPSNVIRCHIASVSPQMTYRSALSFRRAFEPPKLLAMARPDEATGRLLEEHERLAAAVHQLSMRFGGTSANPAGDSASLLASLVASVDSTRGQTDPRLLKQLAQCFNALAAEVETGASTQAMGADLAERLKAVLPAQRVRLARDAEGDRTPMPGSETIYFDVPGSAGSHSRLEIDFPSDCRLERWHLQLLRCAAQLTGVIADVDRLRSFEREGGTSLQAPPLEPRLDTPPGWERLVVRYVDGRMLKGYAKAFIPSRGYVNVSPRPDAPAESAVSVPLAQLKAIFFVHDLNRLPDDAPQTLGCTGRRVEVTFSDGEVLRGATLNYTSTGRGFFVWPEDRRTNNIRAFVVRSAVRRAQLL